MLNILLLKFRETHDSLKHSLSPKSDTYPYLRCVKLHPFPPSNPWFSSMIEQWFLSKTNVSPFHLTVTGVVFRPRLKDDSVILEESVDPLFHRKCSLAETGVWMTHHLQKVRIQTRK